jgi:hypothetical protein
MREPDRTQLPLVETFGEQLERAIATRGRSRWRVQRRALGLAFAAGLVAVSLVTSPGRAASGLVGEWLGLAEPGDPATVDLPRPRGEGQTEPMSSIVLAAGRAPDGVRYEFVLENFGEWTRSPVGDFRSCLNIEWPDARAGQINPQFGCFPAFPPAVVDETVVKFGGAIFDPSYTTHVQLAGLARADVSDVRVLYKDEHGDRRDAPVDFAGVTGALAERVGADAPFGIFFAFLPPEWLGWGAKFDPRACPPEENPYDAEAIEVIAYDHEGHLIATKTGNNINSWAGPPPCPR